MILSAEIFNSLYDGQQYPLRRRITVHENYEGLYDQEIFAMMEEIRENPQDFRFAA